MGKIERNQGARYIELDSLRGLAALTVFFSHAVNMLNHSGGLFNAVNYSVFHIFWDGTAAVVLFFVLSGFVLALPFVGENSREPDYITFIIKRVFRIYPAYLFALAFAICIKTLIFNKAGLADFSSFVTGFWNWELGDLTLKSIIRHIVMVGPWFDRGEIDPIIWSLVVEMKVSILFPFIILFIKELRSIRTGLMLLMVSPIVYKLADKALLERVPLINDDVVFYLFMFILGALMAKFKSEIIGFIRRLPMVVNAVMFCIGIVFYTSMYSLHWLGLFYDYYFYVISIGVAIIISCIIALPEKFKVLAGRPVKLLGDISYSLYLLHFPILMACTSVIYQLTKSVFLSYAVSLIITLVMSYLSYKWIEVPFQRFGRSIANKVDPIVLKYKSNIAGIITAGNGVKTPIE